MGERTRLSYVEVVIITVVLSIVVMTMGPKLTRAGVESKLSALIDGLEAMRVQLDLYRAQHDESFPPCDSFESFKTAMITERERYGLYLKKIPVNPFNNLNTIRFDGEPAGAGIAGWRFDTQSGLFQADNSCAHAAL
jgi:type II secretory pathway pseudopilin PulG